MSTLLPEEIQDQEYDLRSEAEVKWKEMLRNNEEEEEETIPIPPNSVIQAEWDAPLIKQKDDQLMQRPDNQGQVDQARLLAVASEHASDWLNAIPIPSLGLKMDNMSVRLACGLRLGTKLCEPHRCQCGAQVDTSGHHGLSCGSAGAPSPYPRK